jgi:hypothetical protein
MTTVVPDELKFLLLSLMHGRKVEKSSFGKQNVSRSIQKIKRSIAAQVLGQILMEMESSWLTMTILW